MSLLVKICGLNAPDALDAALVEGADMVGFVFFKPSPRNVTPAAARAFGQDLVRDGLATEFRIVPAPPGAPGR